MFRDNNNDPIKEYVPFKKIHNDELFSVKDEYYDNDLHNCSNDLSDYGNRKEEREHEKFAEKIRKKNNDPVKENTSSVKLMLVCIIILLIIFMFMQVAQTFQNVTEQINFFIDSNQSKQTESYYDNSNEDDYYDYYDNNSNQDDYYNYYDNNLDEDDYYNYYYYNSNEDNYYNYYDNNSNEDDYYNYYDNNYNEDDYYNYYDNSLNEDDYNNNVNFDEENYYNDINETQELKDYKANIKIKNIVTDKFFLELTNNNEYTYTDLEAITSFYDSEGKFIGDIYIPINVLIGKNKHYIEVENIPKNFMSSETVINATTDSKIEYYNSENIDLKIVDIAENLKQIIVTNNIRKTIKDAELLVVYCQGENVLGIKKEILPLLSYGQPSIKNHTLESEYFAADTIICTINNI